MAEFERSLAKVLVHEGGYINHPKDPGGATNQGVTQAVYDTYRQSVGLPKRDVRKLETVERDNIYRTRYWSLVKGDSLPAGVSYVVFDGAVNSGVSRSVKWLQRALGVPADGVVGPQTLVAARAHPNPDALIDKICDLRLAFLQQLKTWPTFGKGWASRVSGVRSVGKAWADGDSGLEAPFVAGGNSKAREADARPAPAMGLADVSTGAGVGAGTLAGAVQQAQDQLSPVAGASQFIGNVVAGLALAGAVLTVGGLAYRWWAARRRSKLADALQ